MSLTKREEYIKSFFIPVYKNPEKTYISEEEAETIVKKISEIGNKIGFVGNERNSDKEKNNKRNHKYDVWIAKEAKKDLVILDRFNDIRLIVDWVISTKTDILKFDFEQAYEMQKEWHKAEFCAFDIKDINIPNVDNNRIIYRCKDKEHFFYLLSESDLKYEGKLMNSCVKGSNYKSKVKNLESLIISIRNIQNIPQVTIEIDVNKFEVIQQLGPGNNPVDKKHIENIYDFLSMVYDFKDLKEKEVVDFLNPQLFKPPIS